MKNRSFPISAVVGSQPALFTSVRWPKAKRPKRADCLALVETVVDWAKLEQLVRPYYKADERKRGRKGYSLKMMSRCLVVQWLWNLSDEGMESVILDSHATAIFIGTDPWAPRPPSASSLRTFRALLRNTGILEEFTSLMVFSFGDKGISCQTGAIQEPIFRRLPE